MNKGDGVVFTLIGGRIWFVAHGDFDSQPIMERLPMHELLAFCP